MNTTFNSIPQADAFEVLHDGHGVILAAYEVAHLTTALEGIQTLIAVLQQREIDQDNGEGEGVTFGPNVAIGLISALASCIAFAQSTMEAGALMGERAAMEHANRKATQ